jgi:Ca2+-binding EF-hand superfamily protein
MPFFVAIAATLAFAAQVDDEPPITVTGRPWAPFISPMGEPFRARSTGDDPLERWFQQADRNRDGLLTVDEMRADAVRFFQTLDGNEDGEIDPEELVVYESDIAPEVQVNTKWKRSPQPVATAKPVKHGDDARRERWRADDNVDGYQIHGLQGAARYGLLNIPQPVAGADADFNRGTTLDEFERAAIQRFQLLDSKRTGRLTLPELEVLLPNRPKAGTRIKHPKNDFDTRVGVPFPAKD